MELTFSTRTKLSGDIWLYQFVPTTPLAWEAGQSVRIEMPTLYGPEDHRFTIASITADNTVAVITRHSNSLYKQAMAALQSGTIVRAYGIEGGFIWGNYQLPRVFIAAGVGISPFYAMLKQRIHDAKPLSAAILYSSRDDPIPWQQELQAWQKMHPELQLHFFPNTRISSDLVHSFFPDLTRRVIYVSGPTRMVDMLSNSLMGDYQLPESQLLRDWFTGQLSPDG